MNFQGMGCKGTVDGSLSLSLCRGPIGEPVEGAHLQGTEIVEGGLRKWSISLYRSSVRGTWRRKRRLWDGCVST